jgi:hypothetical protein
MRIPVRWRPENAATRRRFPGLRIDEAVQRRDHGRIPIRDLQGGHPIRILSLALPLILGCTAPATGLDPDAGSQIGAPLGRSAHLRSGHFTYRLGSIERNGDELRVDFRFSNGTHRDYRNVMLRVILFGDGGEIHAARLPVGAMLSEQTKPLVARIDGVAFPVQDLTLELIYALP